MQLIDNRRSKADDVDALGVSQGVLKLEHQPAQHSPPDATPERCANGEVAEKSVRNVIREAILQ